MLSWCGALKLPSALHRFQGKVSSRKNFHRSFFQKVASYNMGGNLVEIISSLMGLKKYLYVRDSLLYAWVALRTKSRGNINICKVSALCIVLQSTRTPLRITKIAINLCNQVFLSLMQVDRWRIRLEEDAITRDRIQYTVPIRTIHNLWLISTWCILIWNWAKKNSTLNLREKPPVEYPVS